MSLGMIKGIYAGYKLLRGLKEGIDKLFGKIQKVKDAMQSYFGQPQVSADLANLIIDEIKLAIDESGLQTVSGHLKDSFQLLGVEKTGGGYVYRIVSTARYASYLNYGTAPSYGRYVPAIGKRRKAEPMVETNMHRGNRAYNFLEIARNNIMADPDGKIGKALNTNEMGSYVKLKLGLS